MNKYPKADTAGIFRKLLADEWLIQSYTGGIKYVKGSVILQSSVAKPVYSYGHNYNKFDTDFSLFMWTEESDINKVGKYFDAVVKDLTEEQIQKVINDNERFLYVDKEYNGTT